MFTSHSEYCFYHEACRWLAESYESPDCHEHRSMSQYLNKHHLLATYRPNYFSTSFLLFYLHTMSEDWEAKTVIGFKRQTAKVTKKDSDLNGAYSLNIWRLLNS